MILNLLSLGFFILLWLMAAKGLADAAGPFMRRLSIMVSRMQPRSAPKSGQSRSLFSTV